MARSWGWSSSLLYGVKPLDWVTIAATVIVLFGCCAFSMRPLCVE
jgi:hypothetical protein